MPRQTIPARALFARPQRARRAITPPRLRGLTARRVIATVVAALIGGAALVQISPADAAKNTRVYGYRAGASFPTPTGKPAETNDPAPSVPTSSAPETMDPPATTEPSTSPAPISSQTAASAEPGSVSRLAFTYPDRQALLADGWSFQARTGAGAARDTEKAGQDGIAYSGSGLEVTADVGDLWKDLNNTRNTIFRDLPEDWTDVQLELDFAPTADYQQAGLAIYGSDDDYVQVIRQYNSSEGTQSVGFVAESGQRVVTDRWVPTTATSLLLRLARIDGGITGGFSTDGGATWRAVSSSSQQVSDPRLALTVGADTTEGKQPVATLHEAVIATGDAPLPTATPTPTSTATPTSTPTPTPTVPWTPTPTPTPTITQPPVTPTPTPTPSRPQTDPTPTPTPSRPQADPTPTPTPTVTNTPATPTIKGFPTRANTGVPAGWTPKQQITGNYTVTQDGAVVEDLRLTGGILYIRAQNVTLRRVEIVSGQINNVWSRACYNGLRIEDSTIVRGSEDIGQPAIQFGGYTALRVKIDGPSEGFRVGGADYGCGPVVIQDSFVNVEPYIECGVQAVDWHGDGLQGYNGTAVTVRNTYIRLGQAPGCGGNSPFFYPVNQGNTRATVENLLVEGGGFSFRLEMPGSVTGLKVVDDSWIYGPVYNRDACSQISWGSGNEIVSVNSDGSLRSVRPLSCSGT